MEPDSSEESSHPLMEELGSQVDASEHRAPPEPLLRDPAPLHPDLTALKDKGKWGEVSLSQEVSEALHPKEGIMGRKVKVG